MEQNKTETNHLEDNEYRLHIGNMPKENIKTTSFTPDGKYIAFGGGAGTIHLVELESGKEVQKFKGHKNSVESLDITSNGNLLVSGGFDHSIKIWDIFSGNEVLVMTGHTNVVSSIAITHDDKYIFSGSCDGTIRQWDLKSGEEIQCFKISEKSLKTISITSSGRYVLSGYSDGTITLYDIGANYEVWSMTAHDNVVSSITVVEGDNLFVSGGWDGKVYLYELLSGKKIQEYMIDDEPHKVYSVVVTPDSKKIICGEWDNIYVWELDSGRRFHGLHGSKGLSSYSVNTSNDGQYIVSGHGASVKIWKIATGEEVLSYESHNSTVKTAAQIPGSNYIVFGGGDGTVHVWDLYEGTEIQQIKGDFQSIDYITVTGVERYIAATGWGDNIKLYKTSTGRTVKGFKYNYGAACLENMPDGKHMAVGHPSESIFVLEIPSGNIVKTFFQYGLSLGSANTMAATEDGQTIIAGYDDGKIRFFDLITEKQMYYVKSACSSIKSIAITKDGNFMASTGISSIVQLWKVDNENVEEVWHFDDGRGEWFYAIDITPNDRYVITGDTSGLIRIFDIHQGIEVRQINEYNESIRSIIATSDSKHIVTGSESGAIRIYELETGIERASIVIYDDGEWIIKNMKDEYNCSKNAYKYFSFVKDNETIEIIDSIYRDKRMKRLGLKIVD